MNWYKIARDVTEDLSEDEFEEEFGSYMKPVDSECISYIGYYEPLRMLEIQFKRTGKRYIYSGVPKEIYKNFMSAKSKGEFYNRIIRPQYIARLNP